MRNDLKGVIHKHRLSLKPGVQKIATTISAKPVHVGLQDGQITVWIEREVSAFAKGHPCDMYFQVVATGEEFPIGPKTTDREYLATVQIDWTVWHIYRLTHHYVATHYEQAL